MPSFKRPGMQFTEAQRIKNLRIAIERGKCKRMNIIIKTVPSEIFK